MHSRSSGIRLFFDHSYLSTVHIKYGADIRDYLIGREQFIDLDMNGGCRWMD